MPFYLLVAERNEANGTLTSKNVAAIHSGKDGELPSRIIDIPSDPTSLAIARFQWKKGVSQPGAILILNRLPLPDPLSSDSQSLRLDLDLGVAGEDAIAGAGLVSGGVAEPTGDSVVIFVKDRERVLFTTADGFACTAIYRGVDVGGRIVG